jgi:hypothetical protein
MVRDRASPTCSSARQRWPVSMLSSSTNIMAGSRNSSVSQCLSTGTKNRPIHCGHSPDRL